MSDQTPPPPPPELPDDPELREIVERSRGLLRDFDSRSGWQAMVAKHGPVTVKPETDRHQQRGWLAGTGRRTATVAAALLIGICLWFGPSWSGASNREFVTARGMRSVITLRDGTHVVLGPASRLRVPSDFGRGARTADLDGEALFTVTHDAAHPFSVRTARAVATDIGTQFDVRAYANDRDVRVAVVEGRVGIDPQHTLGAGDIAVIDTVIAITRGVDVAALTAWTTGTFVLHQVPLGDALADLARWYGFEIDPPAAALAAKPVTVVVSDTAPDQTLSTIGLLVHARVVRNGRHVTFVPDTHDR